MLAKYSEKMTPKYLEEHCRYKIWQHTKEGLDRATVVAYCETVADAKRLIRALSECPENSAYEYQYELCADFIQIKDVLM